MQLTPVMIYLSLLKCGWENRVRVTKRYCSCTMIKMSTIFMDFYLNWFYPTDYSTCCSHLRYMDLHTCFCRHANQTSKINWLSLFLRIPFDVVVVDCWLNRVTKHICSWKSVAHKIFYSETRTRAILLKLSGWSHPNIRNIQFVICIKKK